MAPAVRFRLPLELAPLPDLMLARVCGRYCTVVAGLCSTVEVVGVKDLVDDGAQRFGVSVGPCTSGACAQWTSQ